MSCGVQKRDEDSRFSGTVCWSVQCNATSCAPKKAANNGLLHNKISYNQSLKLHSEDYKLKNLH
jgi:hypothetical protein